MIKTAKLIGICEKGIEFAKRAEESGLNRIKLELIEDKKDVDKEYVRTLLDDIDILYLAFSSAERRAIEIVKAIGFMASERKVLCIGFDVNSEKAIKIDEIDRYVPVKHEELEELVKMMDMTATSIADDIMINLDITDLRDVMITEKGIKYSYIEADYSENADRILELVDENTKEDGEEFLLKKCIAIIEGKTEGENGIDLSSISEIMEKLGEKCSDRGYSIFAIIPNDEAEKMSMTVFYN